MLGMSLAVDAVVISRVAPRTPSKRQALLAVELIGVSTYGGCVADAESELAVQSSAIIYEQDTREEPYDLDLPWIEHAVGRAVALIPAGGLPGHEGPATAHETETGSSSISTAAHRLALCAEERFATQPTLAACSGVLLSPDLVLTAGHCFAHADDCAIYSYALNYLRADADAAVMPESLACRELLVREVGTLPDGSPVDYALVRLQQPATRDAPPWPPARSPRAGDDVVVVGFPLGLPLKIDPAGRVLATSSAGFDLAADTYQGSSGSAIYDLAGQLVGIVDSGRADFELDEERGCVRSVQLPADAAGPGEHALAAWLPLARACHRIADVEECDAAGLSGREARQAAPGSAGDGAPSCAVKNPGGVKAPSGLLLSWLLTVAWLRIRRPRTLPEQRSIA